MHPDVGDITGPHLIRPIDFKAPEEIRKDSVLVISLTQFRFGIDGLDAHQAHQASNPLLIDDVTLLTQTNRHPSNAVEGGASILGIDEPQQILFIVRDRTRLVVPARTVQPQKLALSKDR